jgi:hypothetical protein
MRSARAKHDFPPAAPWERLRAWIDEKQAWEKANNHKAELSKNELTAISQLVPFVVEPDVSDADYVSRLQSKSSLFPDPIGIHFSSLTCHTALLSASPR